MSIDSLSGLTWRDKIAINALISGIETEARTATAYTNPFVSRGNMLEGSHPPRNVAVESSPGVMGIKWEPSLSRYVKFYEVQIAADGGFAVIVRTGQTTELDYPFYGGISGGEYWIRVRTHTRDGISVWSESISSIPGLVYTEDLARDAITRFFSSREEVTDSSRYLEIAPAEMSASLDYAASDIHFYGGAVYTKFIVAGYICTAETHLDATGSGYYPTLRVQLVRDGVPLGDEFFAGYSTEYSYWPITLAGSSHIWESSEGTCEIALRITVLGMYSGEPIYFNPTSIEIFSLEFRR